MKASAMLRRAAVGVMFAGLSVAMLLLIRERGWIEPSVSGGPAAVRLISNEQYLTTIRDLFGENISVEVSFPPLQRRQGLLALGASTVVITPGSLEQFDRAARMVAMQVLDAKHRAVLVPCRPASESRTDAACARQFFARVGRLLYRRPLTESELETHITAAGQVAEELGDFYTGLAYSLAGMLTSPKFLYITELTEPDPAKPQRVRLNGYAKASRLSFLLWDAPPDEALLNAAETGELHDTSGLKRQVERLLDSPRMEQGIRAFFSDLLDFTQFDTLSKDPVIYPAFTRSVARSAKEQTLRLITDHLLAGRGDYRDLFTTSRTFVDGTLGPLYNAPVPYPQEWIPLELQYRAGLLTSLSFLTLHSHPGRSSPTRRGKAMREQLLCQKVPEAPPNVNFAVFEDPNRHFKTARDRLTAHSTDPVCAGCHKLTDPVGLALETFDGAGQFRATESGVTIDISGNLDGQVFVDTASIGQAVHDHPALVPCLVSRWYAYGIGRPVVATDRPWLAYISRRFAVHRYRVPELLREIATSRAFYTVSEEQGSDDIAMPVSAVTAETLP